MSIPHVRLNNNDLSHSRVITEGLDRILLMRGLGMGGGGGGSGIVDFWGGNAKERKRESPDLDFQRLASLQNCELTKQIGLVS